MPIYLTIAYIIFVGVPVIYAAVLIARHRQVTRSAAELERELNA